MEDLIAGLWVFSTIAESHTSGSVSLVLEALRFHCPNRRNAVYNVLSTQIGSDDVYSLFLRGFFSICRFSTPSFKFDGIIQKERSNLYTEREREKKQRAWDNAKSCRAPTLIRILATCPFLRDRSHRPREEGDRMPLIILLVQL
jgi:hypothetical protein